MALPTVSFHSATAGTGSALLSVWMPQLHSMLLAKGWTIEYADSDAIGSGSAGSPAWDKAPATSTDAGIAVYRMPANDHATQWYVRLRPGWAASTVRPYMRGLQLGAAHDGTGGLSGGSTEIVPGVTTGTFDNQAWMMSVSEDGFTAAIEPGTASRPAFCVERARLLDGTVTDRLIAWNKYTTNDSGAFRVVDAAVGQVNDALPVGFSGITLSFDGNLPSLEGGDATSVAAVGPYFTGGNPLYAPPRLAFLGSPVDVAANTDREVVIDGSSKTYRAAPGSLGAQYGIWLFATE